MPSLACCLQYAAVLVPWKLYLAGCRHVLHELPIFVTGQRGIFLHAKYVRRNSLNDTVPNSLRKTGKERRVQLRVVRLLAQGHLPSFIETVLAATIEGCCRSQSARIDSQFLRYWGWDCVLLQIAIMFAINELKLLTVRRVQNGYETVREFVETTGMLLSRHIMWTSPLSHLCILVYIPVFFYIPLLVCMYPSFAANRRTTQ